MSFSSVLVVVVGFDSRVFSNARVFFFSAAHLVARFACAFLFAAHLYSFKRGGRRMRGSRGGSNESDRLLDPFPDIPRLYIYIE